MQVISLLLLALGATALPTTLDNSNTTDTSSPSASHLNHLEARWNRAWVGSSSIACKTTGLDGPRPENFYTCLPFQPIDTWVSIFWGTGIWNTDRMHVFDNTDCSGKPRRTIWKKGGDNDCVQTTDKERQRWTSVAFE